MQFRLAKAAVRLVSQFLVRLLAKRFGLVPLAEMQAALAEKERIETELRHRTRNLEHQVCLRDRLEKEVTFLRELQLAHARNESDTHKAVTRLDDITNNLIDMMKNVWPAAHALDDESVDSEPSVA